MNNNCIHLFLLTPWAKDPLRAERLLSILNQFCKGSQGWGEAKDGGEAGTGPGSS